MRLGNRIRRRIAFISRAWLKPVPGVASGVAQNKYRLASHCFQLLNAVTDKPSANARALVFRHHRQGSKDVHHRRVRLPFERRPGE